MKSSPHIPTGRKLLVAAIISAASLSLSARINSPLPDGYFERGLEMYSQGNYNGCIDQLTAVNRNALSPSELESLDWTLSMAAYHTSGQSAINHFRRFIATYPQSVLRWQATLRIADCLLESSIPEAFKVYSSIDPESLPGNLAEELQYHKAYCMVHLADFKSAAAIFNSLVHSREFGPAAKFYLGYIDYVDGRYESAMKWFNSCDSSSAPGDMAIYYVTQIDFIKGDYAKALDNARKLLSRINSGNMRGIDPGFVAETYRIAGESLYETGRPDEALPYLEKYLSLTDNPFRSALYILGLSKYEAGDYDGAYQFLSKVTDADDAMAQSSYLYLGQISLKNGDNDAAIMAFDKALKMSHDKDVQEAAYYNYAVAKLAGGNIPFSSSAATFENFLRKFPNSTHAQDVQQYIVAGYLSEKNYDAALNSINSMKKPTRESLKAKQQILYALGANELKKGNADMALNYLSQASKLASYDAETARQTQLLAGEAYLMKEDYDNASEQLLSYIKSAPRDDANLLTARYDLGYVRYNQKRYDLAKSNFTPALELASKSPDVSTALKADIYNRLGDIAYYASDFTGASANYGKALELNPDAGDYPMLQQALMQGYARNYSKKIEILQQLRAKYPSSPLIPEALLEITEARIQLNDNPGAITTYKEIIALYPSTSQARQAYLQMALIESNMGRKEEAKTTYRDLIRNYPTSDEASDAVAAMQRITAEDGTLNQFISFLEGIPGAPRIDVSQVEKLTFEVAEKDYLDKNSVARLSEFIDKYPSGNYTAQALEYLLEYAVDNHEDDDAFVYAKRIVENYPHRRSAEEAREIVASQYYLLGRIQDAMEQWQVLANTASAPDTRLNALEGVLACGLSTGNNQAVISAANRILATSNINETTRRRVIADKADALAASGDMQQAAALWASVAEATDDINGAKSAYKYAQYLFDRNETASAKAKTEKFVNSGTPHAFWLAKGFILLSDIYAADGKEFEAAEYLKALKENYPGNEPEILDAVDTRLRNLDK